MKYNRIDEFVNYQELTRRRQAKYLRQQKLQQASLSIKQGQ